jgi:enoyl-CoA hydratase/carnithine racemase
VTEATSEKVSYDVSAGIATITMNAPEQRNAFDNEMLEALPVAFERARLDADVSVVVFTGAGKAFSAGGDIKSMGTDTDPVVRKADFTDNVHRLPRAIERLDKPIIAMLNGAAVGAGLDMALMCDFRIAAETARFAEGYIGIGLVPGVGGAYLLPRLVGLTRAIELLFTGRSVTGLEAAEIGLVTRAVPDADLERETYALAAQLARMPPIALRTMKRLIYESLNMQFSAALELASSQVAILMCGDEHRAEVSALKERLRSTTG